MGIIKSRRESIIKLLNEIESLQPIRYQEYVEEWGYTDIVDGILIGNLNALKQFANAEGWDSIAEAVDQLDLESHRAVEILQEAQFILSESRRLVSRMSDDDEKIRTAAIWDHVHPRIKAVARRRFETGHLADSVEAAFKEINSVVKSHVKDISGREYDGADLMWKAFTQDSCMIQIADLNTESGRSFQNGFGHIFAGAMMGIRNPAAHENVELDRAKALHHLYLASLLMSVFDERREPETHKVD